MFLLFHTRKSLFHFTRNSTALHRSTHASFSLYHHFSTCPRNHQSIAAAASSSNSSAVSDLLIRKHQISPQVASRVAFALVHVEKDPNKLDPVISFLNHYGFSKIQLERLMKCNPRLLLFKLDKTLKPKFEHFHNFGFSNTQIVVMVSNDPWILTCSLSKTIAPSLTALNGLLGSKAEVLKLVMKSHWLLSHDLEKTLVPNIDYLLSCGVAMDQIRRNLHWRFLLQKPESMKQLVDRADRLGADRSSGMFLHVVRVSSINEEIWERKLQWFRELGCSEGDISGIIRKAPSVFGFSLETLKSKLKAFREFGFSEADIYGLIRNAPVVLGLSFKKLNMTKEVLLSTGKYTVESIIRHPMALMYSVEKRYMPRLGVLGVLEHKKLIKEWPNLGVLCRQTDRKFFEKFVAPHLNEISEVLPNVASR